jgi:hypothetical protein
VIVRVNSGTLEFARIQPHLELFEESDFCVWDLKLAFCCFFELAVERGTKVIRVEAEEILVQSVCFFLFSDDESHCVLEVFAMPQISIGTTT